MRSSWRTRRTIAGYLAALLGLGAAAIADGQTPPTLQDARFLGGRYQQAGVAVAERGQTFVVAGAGENPIPEEVFPPGALLLRFDVPPCGTPVLGPGTIQDRNAALFGAALTGTRIFGAGQKQVNGIGKPYLALYDLSGNYLQSSTTSFLGDREESYLTAAANTEGGTDVVYAAGFATTDSQTQVYVMAKYDASGQILYQLADPGLRTSFCQSNPDYCTSYFNGLGNGLGLTVGSNGIYVAGISSVPCGVNSVPCAISPNDDNGDNNLRPALMLYDTNLNLLWQNRSTPTSPCGPAASPCPGWQGQTGQFFAATSLAGDIYAVGLASNDVGTGYLIERYDAAGNRLWSVVDPSNDDALTGVVALGNRLFAAGYIYTPDNGYDVIVVEIDPATGAVKSNSSFGGPRDDKAFGITTDGNDLYVVGESRSFASPAGNAVGEADVMLLHYVFGNRPPVASAGPNQTLSAGPTCTASVALDGSASTDPDLGDTLTYAWTWSTGSAAGPTPTVALPKGSNLVTLTVTDSHCATSTSTVTITVNDVTPPVFSNVPGPIATECAGPTGTQVAVPSPTATDNCDGAVPVTNNAPTLFPLGTTTVTFTATDSSGNTATATTTVTVRDSAAPVFSNVPAPITVQIAGPNGTPVTVPLPTATDTCSGTTVPVTSDAPPLFPLGTTTVTFTAKDPAGNTATATTTVTVVDTTPPGEICLTANPKVLWPPNHKMVPVTVKVCDSKTWKNCQIFSVSSSEPVNSQGDGNTAFDWQITGPLTLNLRAERSGEGSGRVYTITVHCTDTKGNTALSTVKVTVPKSQGDKDH